MSLSSRGSASNLDDDNEKLPMVVYGKIAGVLASTLPSRTSRLVREGSVEAIVCVAVMKLRGHLARRYEFQN